ncbi:MAG: hypothetical protein WCD20_16380 [Rhodomicrobium sp.]
MKRPLSRAKRLFEVQHQLYRMELLKLHELQHAAAQAQKAERDALSLLSAGHPAAIPLQLVARMPAAASIKVRASQSMLEAQMARTLDLSGKESVARQRLDAERADHSKLEAKRALEAAVDAFLERERS